MPAHAQSFEANPLPIKQQRKKEKKNEHLRS
jgi:hypothetical protein